MKRLTLVVGAGGQLGEAMATELGPRHEVVTRSRDELDVAVPDAVRATVASVCPDVIINCAAYTSVDGAQQAPVAALEANAWAVRTLARAAADIDAVLVHFSTDFVFDGETDRPYTEADAPNPQGTYAVTKLLGEWLAADAPRHYVLRVESLFGGRRARSSIDRLLDGIRSGTRIRTFSDRTVSPSYVDDVVRATGVLIGERAPYGLYHCVNTGWTTWTGIGRELARLAGAPDVPIDEVHMDQAGLLTPRPRFAALDNGKLREAGVEMPTWQDALARYVRARGAEEFDQREV
jgi:dTDP-4-dehydrorhamnose reductase